MSTDGNEAYPFTKRELWIAAALLGGAMLMCVFFALLLANANSPPAVLIRGERVYVKHATDEELKILVGDKSISHVIIYSDLMTDRGMVHIASIPRIESLSLYAPKLSDRGMKEFERMPYLKELTLKCPRVTGRGVVHLLRLPLLRDLEIEGSRFDEESFESFQFAVNLEILSFDGTDIPNDSLSILLELPKLKDLSLENTNLTDLGVQQLGGFESDAGVVFLRSCETLQHLSLVNSKVTDISLGIAKSLPQLKSLDVRGTRVTKAGVAALQKQRPALSIQWNGVN